MVRVEYKRTPPQVLVSRLNRIIRESQELPNCRVRISWESLEDEQEDDETSVEPEGRE